MSFRRYTGPATSPVRKKSSQLSGKTMNGYMLFFGEIELMENTPRKQDIRLKSHTLFLYAMWLSAIKKCAAKEECYLQEHCNFAGAWQLGLLRVRDSSMFHDSLPQAGRGWRTPAGSEVQALAHWVLLKCASSSGKTTRPLYICRQEESSVD